VHEHGPSVRARPQGGADPLVPEHQRFPRAGFVRGLAGPGDELSVGDTHGRKIQHPPEVNGEPTATWMVASRRIKEDDIHILAERADRPFEYLAHPQREVPRSVWCARLGSHDVLVHRPYATIRLGPSECRRRPQRVSGPTHTDHSGRTGDERAGHLQRSPGRRFPRPGFYPTELDLSRLELVLRGRPVGADHVSSLDRPR
jgi:hypothetical protein